MKTSAPPLRNSKLVLLCLFGIAMGLLEAIVVVYLRELYFPDGFRFPLRYLPGHMLRTEMLRELSTIVMLAMAAGVAAKKPVLRFALFLFTFGVWDIFYYVFLKVLLDWPQSFFTWDVLFLIPITWVGPVLAPVLCSLLMIGIGLLFIRLDRRYERVRLDKTVWLLMAAGAGLIIFSFVRDYAGIIIEGGFYKDMGNLADNKAFQTAVAVYVPVDFHWSVFGAGAAFVLLSAFAMYRKTRRT